MPAKMNNYKVNTERLTSLPEFAEASKEELRTLLALIEADGAPTSPEKLAEAASVSRSRASAAISFWREAGIITECEKAPSEPTITEEFEERVEIGAKIERGAAEVAKSIRDNSLAELIDECARIVGKPALSTDESKQIVALYTDYSLDEEYIITLAAHLSESKKRLSIPLIAGRAEALFKRGVTTLDELLSYISEKNEESEFEWEFKSIFGIYNRSLSPAEREYAQKWLGEFCFGAEIIKEAYGISTNSTSGLSYPYIDAILERWKSGGCKTVEDCKSLSEKEKPEQKTAEEKPARKPRTPKKETPRYGDFNPLDAFAKALTRSYSEDGKK